MEWGQPQLDRMLSMPLGHQWARRMYPHHGIVRAARHKGPVNRVGVGAQIGDEVHHLVTERHVETAPTQRNVPGRIEPQGSRPRQAAGVGDRGLGRVVSAPFGDVATVVEHPQESSTVASDVKYPPAGQVGIDGFDHRLPDEAMFVLHRLVLGGAPPVRGLVAGHVGHSMPMGSAGAAPNTRDRGLTNGAARI